MGVLLCAKVSVNLTAACVAGLACLVIRMYGEYDWFNLLKPNTTMRGVADSLLLERVWLMQC